MYFDLFGAENRTINAKEIRFDSISHHNPFESIIFIIKVYVLLIVIRQQAWLFL